MSWSKIPGLTVALVAVVVAATIGTATTVEEDDNGLSLRSPAFPADGSIPVRFTCEGEDLSPPLEWSGVPAAARSLVLIVDDPDAPDPAAPQMTWVHWVLWDLPPDSTGLAEGVAPPDLPEGTARGHNDWDRPGYGGPCPPIGRHRYVFKLYALDTVLGELETPTKTAVEHAMSGHVIDRTELIGTYAKDN